VTFLHKQRNQFDQFESSLTLIILDLSLNLNDIDSEEEIGKSKQTSFQLCPILESFVTSVKSSRSWLIHLLMIRIEVD
jgi:hypothetical protein